MNTLQMHFCKEFGPNVHYDVIEKVHNVSLYKVFFKCETGTNTCEIIHT